MQPFILTIPTRHHTCYRDDMIRTTVSMPRELLERLRLMAAERRTSVADLVRDALEEKAASYRPGARSLGIGASGYGNRALRAGHERPEPRSWR